jgi:Bacterial PH domain
MIGSRDVTERHDVSHRDWSERNEVDETARTLMSGKTSTKQHLIRQRPPLALAAACGVTGLVLLVSMAWQWSDNPQPLFVAWVIFVLAVVWSLFIRPAVVLDYDGVTFRNVVKDIHIPWVRVTDVEFRWNLKVFVGDQPYTAWAISSQAERPKGGSRGMFAMMPGRLDKLANADAQPSRSAPKVTASLVARSIEQAREEYAEAVAQGLVAAAPEARVRITWVPMVLAIVLLPAIAVLALSLA